jgi:hypothetical protein
VEGHKYPKTDVVVPVVRVVVVADRDTSVVFIVVPRAAAQTTVNKTTLLLFAELFY